MPDREKVISGLKWHGKGFYESCKSCPYHYDGCDAALCRDALALLKEQEPRVMTLERVCGDNECWIEYKFGGCGYADVYLADELDGTAQVYRCRPVGDRKPETVWLHDYGKLWRGWSFRPTPEQMRDTPWEGEKE